MIQDKELLLKDLCARLPYGVKMNHIANNNNEPTTLIGIAKNTITLEGNGGYSTANVEEFKPYLFPLSSMTEEQKAELEQIKNNEDAPYYHDINDFFLKYHLDNRHLIEKRLAIDATELNIY